MPVDPSRPYKVVRAEAVRERLRQLREVAGEASLLEQYVEAIRAIEVHLIEHPLEWGDPLYRLPHLDLVMYRGIYWDIAVVYGVNEAERIVFIKEYDLLPRSPLRPPQD
jgi:hypothetical protein